MKNETQEKETGSNAIAPQDSNAKNNVHVNSKTTAQAEQADRKQKEPPRQQTINTDQLSQSLSLQIIKPSVSSESRSGMTAEYWLSQFADTFNYLFGYIGLPLELRAYVMALIGASDGETDWFDCPDKDLAIRLLGDEADGKTVSALKKKVQRFRGKLRSWQIKHAYNLVETDTGYGEYKRGEGNKIITKLTGKPEIVYHPSRYRLPILTHAVSTLREANKIPGRINDLPRTTKLLIERLHGIPAEPDSAGRLDENKRLRRFCSTGKTNLIRAIQMVREQRGDTRQFLKTVIEELEAEILPTD